MELTYMRQHQSTGSGPYWSAGPTGRLNWQDTAGRVLGDLPAWALAVIAAAVAVVALIVLYLVIRKIVEDRRRVAEERRRVREEEGAEAALMLSGMGPAGRVALGGVLVSLYGLWGFARGTADLPVLIAIGFLAMFDVTELQLFRLLYQTADPRKGKTPQYRLMHGTAWAQVTASAIANFVHAPNLISAPFMAFMPISAAWVIELELRKRMAGDGPAAEEDKSPGGPIRLVVKGWQKLWATLYSLVGIDPGEKSSEMAQKALGRKAARRAYELRLHLLRERELTEKLNKLKATSPTRETQRRINQLQKELDGLEKRGRRPRARAQRMLMRGDLHEPAATLELLRRMAWLTRTDDVALLEYGPDSDAMAVMEQLNVAANADFVKASKRAAEADARAKEAEEQRQEHEKALAEAKEQIAALQQQIEAQQKAATVAAEKAAKEAQQEEERLRLLREERERLENSGASADQLYKKAAQDLEETRQQLTTLTGQATEAREAVARLQGEQRVMQERLQAVEAERDAAAAQAKQAGEEAQRAAEEARQDREENLRLQERVAAFERLQLAASAAKAAPASRVDARIDADAAGSKAAKGSAQETRQRIRDLLALMTEEERASSKRALARLLIQRGQLSLKEDAVRGHLAAIEQEDEERAAEDEASQGSVPGPRADAFESTTQ